MQSPSPFCDATINSKSPIVLVVGDTDRAEMRPLVSWLDQHVFPAARRVTAENIASAQRVLSADEFPDLIVVLQSWPNENSSTEILGLLSYAPLARVVVCYGAWCESDGRNQNLWPPAVRVPVWSAAARIEREWALIQNPGEQIPLPWSASREEVFVADHPPIPQRSVAQEFYIDSPDPQYKAFLCEWVKANGHMVVQTDATALLFDADPWGSVRATALHSLRERFPQAEIVVLLSLASPMDIADFHQLGITNVSRKLGLHGFPDF
jgi:hypothetical protein